MRTIANSFIILGFIDNKRILDNMSSFVEFPHCKIIDRSIFDEAILNMLSDGYKKNIMIVMKLHCMAFISTMITNIKKSTIVQEKIATLNLHRSYMDDKNRKSEYSRSEKIQENMVLATF
jgi:hypothetical protein